MNIREVEVGEYANGDKVVMKVDMAAVIRKAMGWDKMEGATDE